MLTAEQKIKMMAVMERARAEIGVAKIARAIGRSRNAVYGWKVCPAEFVLKIEELSKGKYTRHQLRPDVFGKPGD